MQSLWTHINSDHLVEEQVEDVFTDGGAVGGHMETVPYSHLLTHTHTQK